MIKFKACLDDLTPYVPGKPIDDVKREFSVDTVTKLASNENPYGCSEKVIAAIKNFNSCALYPDGNSTNLRKKLSGLLNINQNNLIFGSGADELISLLSKAIVEKDDECITASITFSQYEASVKSMSGKMIHSDMKNYGFDLDDILTKITDKTKIIFIANPNNPTGTAFTKQEQSEFVSKVPKNILVVFDEAYAEFAEGIDFPDTLSLIRTYPNVVLLKTFSKAYGLASFRVGYAVACEHIISNLEKIRNPFNVSSIAQIVTEAALDDMDFVNFTVKNNSAVKEYLYSEFDALKLFYIPAYTNFIMLDIKQDSIEIFKKLMSDGFIIRPGAAFGMPSFLRISIGTLDEMKSFVSVLKKYVI